MSDAISELLAAAANPKLTAGPWHTVDFIPPRFAVNGKDGVEIVAPRYKDGQGKCEANLSFIAAARNGIKALVEEMLKYGKHREGCNCVRAVFDPDGKWPCDCGWFARRSQLEAFLEKTK